MSITTPRRLPSWEETSSYFRRDVITWPNAVTTVRFFCTVAIILRPEYHRLVFWLALAGGLSDIIDGWLAKKFKLGTSFGKTYDQWIDWGFGVALMYSIYAAGGLNWYDWPYTGELLVLLAGYHVVRMLFPLVETIWVAKVKTAMQFGGGVVILANFAGMHLTVGDSAVEFTIGPTELVNGGYLLMWSSTSLMALSLRDYVRVWRAKK